MKKGLFVLVISLLLSACGAKTADLVVEKSGEIKAKMGTEYLLNTSEGIVNITSNKINLDDYMKKQVNVKGMYSGSTLYVDEIQSP